MSETCFVKIELVRKNGEHVTAIWHRKFSNFAQAQMVFPGGIRVATAEALYQASKFPRNNELQLIILQKKDPKAAKRLAKYHEKTWDAAFRNMWLTSLRLIVMEWVLRNKFSQNKALAQMLLDSMDAPIVEPSKFDDFWGLIVVSPEHWRGANHLGRMLMRIRAELRSNSSLRVPPPPVTMPWYNPT